MITGLWEKLGFWSPEKIDCWRQKTDWLWFHAVSVGEINAIWPLIEEVNALKPKYPIMISCTTDTGYKLAKQLIGSKGFVLFYFPYDFPHIIKHLFEIVKVRLLIIAETEIWPAVLSEAYRREVPSIIVNARISDRSFRNYMTLNFYFKNIFSLISEVLSQSEKDSEKYTQLGVDKKKVTTLGNIKFCIGSKTRDSDFTPSISSQEFTIINFASTHPGEDEIAVNVYKKLQSKFDKLRLIIAPRHINRTTNICELLKKHNLIPKLRTENEKVNSKNEVYVLDTIGELTNYLRVSDITVLCGSFTNIGGHNILEPIREGSYTIIGPHDFKMTEINDVFKDRKALKQVSNENELLLSIEEAIRNKDLRNNTVNNGKLIIKENENILQETTKRIVNYL